MLWCVVVGPCFGNLLFSAGFFLLWFFLCSDVSLLGPASAISYLVLVFFIVVLFVLWCVVVGPCFGNPLFSAVFFFNVVLLCSDVSLLVAVAAIPYLVLYLFLVVRRHHFDAGEKGSRVGLGPYLGIYDNAWNWHPIPSPPRQLWPILQGEGSWRQSFRSIWSCDVLDCTQSLSVLLVIERLERARCATARETGVSKVDGCAARRCLSLAPVSQLLWMRKDRDCVQSSDVPAQKLCYQQ